MSRSVDLECHIFIHTGDLTVTTVECKINTQQARFRTCGCASIISTRSSAEVALQRPFYVYICWGPRPNVLRISAHGVFKLQGGIGRNSRTVAAVVSPPPAAYHCCWRWQQLINYAEKTGWDSGARVESNGERKSGKKKQARYLIRCVCVLRQMLRPNNRIMSPRVYKQCPLALLLSRELLEAGSTRRSDSDIAD